MLAYSNNAFSFSLVRSDKQCRTKQHMKGSISIRPEISKPTGHRLRPNSIKGISAVQRPTAVCLRLCVTAGCQLHWAQRQQTYRTQEHADRATGLPGLHVQSAS